MIKKNSILFLLISIVLIFYPNSAYSQNSTQDSIEALTLEQCISYALKNQPALQQTIINQSIAKTANMVNLSGWMPQLSLSGNIVHYNELPTTLAANSVPGGPPVPTHTGIRNTSLPEFSATETIFDPQLLSSARKASLNVKQAEQNTDSARINIVSAVSTSYYNLLLTLRQINILEEDTARLGRTVKDTYHQYQGGTVDETDYEQAMITLNNSKTQLKHQVENVAPGYAALKQLMGYPNDKQFRVTYDTTRMEQDVIFDTTKQLQYDRRIEFRQLQTMKDLQHEQTVYYKLAFLPTVSAFYNYVHEFESNTSSGLFKNSYPYSYMGITLSLPIFTGLSRVENMHKSELQEEVLDLSEINLRAQIYKEYSTALANYKSNLYSWKLLKENQDHAKNVYRIVSLQYEQGVVAYLNLIVAESNLISAEIGYTDALFQLLSSKIDLEKAVGELETNF
jgi:outer membrane protein TolC